MIRVTDVISATGVALIGVLAAGCAAEPGTTNASPTTVSVSPTASASPASAASTPSPTSTSDQVLADAAVVLITYGADGDTVFASGIIPDVVESPGICTLTATRGDVARTATIDAMPAASSMNCGTIGITVPPGEWILDLAYDSVGFTGSSGPVTVTVP